MTPTALDYLANYEDAVQQMEFQIDATEAGTNPIVYHPGAAETEPGTGAFIGTRPLNFISYPNQRAPPTTAHPKALGTSRRSTR